MPKILLVDDEESMREFLEILLRKEGYDVICANGGLDAVAKLNDPINDFDVVITDLKMPRVGGMEVLERVKQVNAETEVVVMTAYSTTESAIEAMKKGAYDYISKPFKVEEIKVIVERCIDRRRLARENRELRGQLSQRYSFSNIIGKSDEISQVFEIIERVASTRTSILVSGETGTGKELVAKAIHFNSTRKERRFMAVNCGAIPDQLMESELFGHVRGSFTGAVSDKKGLFEEADKGTLFLDEIGELGMSLQVKLLRVLQEKTFTPVGSNRSLNTDVRIIAASHQSFEEMIKEKTFREDLFYRLNVLPVYLPPLRDRKADLPLLTEHYINYFNNHHNLNLKGITDEVREAFHGYRWPGNIRELRNVVEHAFIIESGELISISSLPIAILGSSSHKKSTLESVSEHDVIDLDSIKDSILDETKLKDHEDYDFKFPSGENAKVNFHEAKEKFEKDFIEHALSLNMGKINQTALKANIPKKTLLRKIEKYVIDPKSFYKNRD